MSEPAVTSMAAEERHQVYLDWMENAPSALSACIHFYALDAALTLDWPHRLAADRLRERIEQEQQLYDRALGYALRDYLALASWGELVRHPDGAGIDIADPRMEVPVDLSDGRTRYELALELHLPTLLNQLQELHVYAWRGGSVSGPRWAEIARLAAEFPGVDDPRKLHVWIDRVWDLKHNSGSAFDKPTIFDYHLSNSRTFSRWLTTKRVAPTPTWLLKECLGGRGPATQEEMEPWWIREDAAWQDWAMFRPSWKWSIHRWSADASLAPYVSRATRRLLARVAAVMGWEMEPWPSTERVWEAMSLCEMNQARIAASVKRVLDYQPLPWGDGPALQWVGRPLFWSDADWAADEVDDEEEEEVYVENCTCPACQPHLYAAQ